VPILIHTRRLIRLLILATLLGSSLRIASAQTLTAPEYKIKAAFLYNFAKLTEWPTNAFTCKEMPLTIGIIGKDPFGKFLDETVKDKIIHGRKVAIERFTELKDDVAKCHLLFIATSEEDQLDDIFSCVAKRPVLTVSEIDRFNFKNGMIWIQKEEDEIKFSIRQTAVHETGLKLSSKLLALAINTKAKGKEEK
jgi:hypothetical protein